MAALRQGRRWTAVALTLLTLTLATACSAPWQGSDVDVITPVRATKVVHDYWTVNEQALMTYNTGLFAKIQSPPLLESQIADVTAAKAAGDQVLKSARPLKKVTTYVPHQQGYPAQFVALVETVKVDTAGNLASDPIGFYYRFWQPSEGAPWKANFYVLASLDQPSRIVDAFVYASLAITLVSGGHYVLQVVRIGHQ